MREKRRKWIIAMRPGDIITFLTASISMQSRPRWHSWMRRPTGNEEVAGTTPH